ncbi:DUF2933 domain-containing protein [Microvirga terrestris]|uniref:DUF2933 domain-containing protein n=1 Tax=Microvirga terrestris TaxID=2791024 RepID=A0ABS0HV52_9HYPH|nr:DUF2933 domain-containing protein [Microvirga terrestris]MBF9197374.1 DUF2933 domain-containing protein [Microvirga terrestris]
MNTKPNKLSAPTRTWRSVLIGSRLGWILTVALAVLGIYLFMTHTGHVLTALSYLLLTACPLIHLFMHKGHAHSHSRDE